MFCEKCGQINEGTILVNMAPGKILLKVTGVLFIIFTVIKIIVLISTAAVFSSMTDLDIDIPKVTSGITLLFIVSIITYVLYMIMGIIGIKYAKFLWKMRFENSRGHGDLSQM